MTPIEEAGWETKRLVQKYGRGLSANEITDIIKRVLGGRLPRREQPTMKLVTDSDGFTTCPGEWDGGWNECLDAIGLEDTK